MINNVSYFTTTNYSANFRKRSNVSFRHNIQTLANINLGCCPEGFIEKVNVRQGFSNAKLNLFKTFRAENVENYTIRDNKNEIVGNVDVFITKCQPVSWQSDSASYVFLDDLRNFSRPGTPYHNPKLDYYKDIGTRLLQVAMKRSYEEDCSGNIRLVSVNEALDWYKNKIAMKQLYPPTPGCFAIHNPNLLFLPEEAKKYLSELQGGL